MPKYSTVICFVSLLAVLLDGPLTARAGAPEIPVPERASTFLDPAELLLRSAPAGALQKLQNENTQAEAMAELNRYFGQYAINKSVVVHTTVEVAAPYPDVRNAFRIRAASVPLKWESGSIQRQSWFYFNEAGAPAANSLKVGSEITVVGWVRKCQVSKGPAGLCFYFDLQHSRIESSTMPMASARLTGERDEVVGGITTGPVRVPGFNMAGTWSWRGSEEIYPGTIDFENDGTGSHGARNNTTWKVTGDREITIAHTTRGTAVINVGTDGDSFVGTDYKGKAVTGKRMKW